MDVVTGAVTNILSMLTSVFTFVKGEPLLLAFVVLPLIGLLLGLVVGIFRR